MRTGGAEPPQHRFVVALRIVLVLLVVALVAGAAWSLAGGALAVDDLVGWVQGAGLLGPAAFVGLYVVAALALVPGTLLAVAGALLFPLPWSILIVWVGATVATIPPYLVARHTGRASVERLVGRRMAALDARVERGGFGLVLVLRLAGLPPYNTMNYLAGLTTVRFGAYLAGTMLGLVPMMVAVVVLVDRIGRAPSLLDLVTDPLLYALVALVAAIAWGAQVLRRRAERLLHPADETT